MSNRPLTKTEWLTSLEKLWEIAQQPRQWVGLTDEERKTICNLADADDWHDFQVMDAVEAKLKERNHG